MKKTVFVMVLMITTVLAANAWADDTYQNCYGVDNCYSSTKDGISYYYSINDGTMTVYGPKEEGASTSLPSHAFGQYTSLPLGATSVKFSGNVNLDNLYVFRDMRNITSIDLKGVQTVGGDAFWGVTGLTSADLTGVQTIGANAFQSTGLTSVNLTGVQTIESYAFDGCSELTSADLSGLQTIEIGAFAGTGLTSIDLTGAQLVKSRAFKNATGLQNIVLGDNLTAIYFDAFENVPSSAKIYCQEGSGHGGKTCAELVNASSTKFNGTIQLFEKGDDGVYVVLDAEGNPSAYYSSTTAMMVGGVEDGCTSKTTCASKIQLAQSGGTNSSLGSGGSSGSSSGGSNGLFKGERGKRIYTVEQANAVAGKKNKVMIRYR